MQVSGGTTTAGPTGTVDPLRPQVFNVVTQELHSKLGQAGVPPVHKPVLRWVMLPELPAGQAICWVSEVGAQIQESIVVLVKVCFCPAKRNVTVDVDG